MLDSPILEIAIGLFFIYLLLSIIATALNEGIANFLKLKAKTFTLSLFFLMYDTSDEKRKRLFKFLIPNKISNKKNLLLERLRKSPYIGPVMQDEKLFSDEVTKEKIGDALSEILLESQGDLEKQVQIDPKLVEAKLAEMEMWNTSVEDPKKQPFMGQLVMRWVGEANKKAGDITAKVGEFRNRVDQVYEDSVNIARNWYKNDIRTLSFIVGFIIAVLFNADSLYMIQVLSSNPEVRETVVAQAESYMASAQSGLTPKYDSTQRQGAWVSTSVVTEQLKLDTMRINRQLAQLQQSDSVAARNNPDYQKLVQQRKVVFEQMTALSKIDSVQGVARTVMEQEIDQLSAGLGLGWASFKDRCWRMTIPMQECVQNKAYSRYDSTQQKWVLMTEAQKKAYVGPEYTVIKRITDGMPSEQVPCACKEEGSAYTYDWLNYGLSPLLGWFITALAITLGAPFWFDVLKKVMSAKKALQGDDKK